MSRRQKARGQREYLFWLEKTSAARTPAAEAAVVWDRLRARIADLDRDAADAVWLRLAATLSHLHSELLTANPASGTANAQPRAGAREATSRRAT